jgi:predicted DCC family thiol-disulfide oxidoreductase YuxK
MTPYPLTVFFDGACPICDREIALMKRLDGRRRLAFCDFSRSDYDTASINISPTELGRVIHARWADGNVITGVEVFRAMWEAVGLGVLAKLSRLSLVEPLVLNAYAWFARNRLRLTGRSHACTGEACRSALSSRHSP